MEFIKFELKIYTIGHSFDLAELFQTFESCGEMRKQMKTPLPTIKSSVANTNQKTIDISMNFIFDFFMLY